MDPGAMGDNPRPDTSVIGNVSAGIPGFSFCQCNRYSACKPGGGTANPAGVVARARSFFAARSRGVEWLHADTRLVGRHAAGSLDSARAAHMGSDGRLGGRYLDLAAWPVWMGLGID